MRSGLCLALLLISGPCLAETAAGVRHLSDVPDGARPLALSVWYPTGAAPSAVIGGNAVFRGVAAAPEAPLPAGPLPLVVVSHGGLRSAADTGAWLSSSLARAGFLVVEVNAPRPDTAAAALDEIWQRPQDMSRAVDRMMGDGEWRARIDPDRISGVGFALGATAALSVAGAPMDVGRYRQSCSPGGGAPGPECRWFAAAGVGLAQTRPDALARPARDPRFMAAVAINPEFDAAFGNPPAGVATLRITLGAGEEIPGAGPVAGRAVLPDATAGDAFATCTAAGPALLAEDGGDAALCGTSPDAREAIHRQVSGLIASFLAGTGR